MSVKHVILGYLSWRPMTGYDIKKIIAESEILPWSANNNQIYRALVQLHNDELVTRTVEEQIGAPNRHVYTITEKGVQELDEWAGSQAQVPKINRPFLYQLMWADGLDPEELDELLEAYLNTVGEKLFFLRVQADERPNMPERSQRERYLWGMIHKNLIARYELELKWIRQVRQDLSHIEAGRHWAVSQ